MFNNPRPQNLIRFIYIRVHLDISTGNLNEGDWTYRKIQIKQLKYSKLNTLLKTMLLLSIRILSVCM